MDWLTVEGIDYHVFYTFLIDIIEEYPFQVILSAVRLFCTHFNVLVI